MDLQIDHEKKQRSCAAEVRTVSLVQDITALLETVRVESARRESLAVRNEGWSEQLSQDLINLSQELRDLRADIDQMRMNAQVRRLKRICASELCICSSVSADAARRATNPVEFNDGRHPREISSVGMLRSPCARDIGNCILHFNARNVGVGLGCSLDVCPVTKFPLVSQQVWLHRLA